MAQGKCWPWYTQRLEERNFISMMCGVQGMLMIFLLERQKNKNKKWNKIDLQQKCTLEWVWKSSCKPRHLSEPERVGKSGLESTDEHCMKLSVQAVWWRPNHFLSSFRIRGDSLPWGLEHSLYVSHMSLSFHPCSTPSCLAVAIQEVKRCWKCMQCNSSLINSVLHWPTKITTSLEKFQSKWSYIGFYINHQLYQ